MSCASRTSTFPDLPVSREAAEHAPCYRRASAILRAWPDKERRRQFLLALEKARQRRLLKELDDRLLADIGVTRADAEREARKPFWK